ncbi:MAG: phospholipid carrier-dependent glycosyltransferase [Pseudomonadota bacterium]
MNSGKIEENDRGENHARGWEDQERPHHLDPKLVILFALGAVHVAITLLVTVPGYISIDEAIYHYMMKSFAATGGLEVWTGYQEFPSWELTHRFLRIHSGRPVSQYPYLFPVVAMPFYLVWGFYGLFLVNSAAFVGTVALCFGIARRLFGDRDLALNSCLILVLAGFSWEYSQSAWPHSTAVLLVTASFYFMVRAYWDEAASSRSLFWAAAAGLTAGFAPGIRMDAFLVIPCIILPFLYARPWMPRHAAAVALAVLPGLAILSITNYIKFGVLSPFSYGTSMTGHTYKLPYLLVGTALAAVAVTWTLSRPTVIERVKRHIRPMAWAGFACLVLVVALPQTRDLLHKVIAGAYMMLVDLRTVDPNLWEPSLRRTAAGGLVYLGGMKKAFLQSMPYLTILVLPLVGLVRRKEDAPALSLLFLVPACVIGFFSYMKDHGGLSLNLRYFLPVLPFTSILTAYAIRHMQTRWDVRLTPTLLAASAVPAVCLYVLTVLGIQPAFRNQELGLLFTPLPVALAVLLFALCGELFPEETAPLMRKPAAVALVMALTWSAVVAFSYDYPLHRNQRVTNYSYGGMILKVVPENSIFFTAPYIDPFMRLIEKDRVRIALPGQDKFKDLPKLVEFHLKAGRKVFAAFPIQYWNELKEGPLAPYSVTPVWDFPGSFVGEVSMPGPEGAGS